MSKWKWLLTGICGLCILCALGVWIGGNMRAQIADSGNALVQETVQRQLNETCRNLLKDRREEQVLCTQTEGKVQMVTANADYMNELAAACNVACQQDLAQYERMTLNLPRGALIGSTYFADKGRPIGWQLHVSYEINTEYLTQCHSVGINQIRYAVYLQIKTNARITIPSIVQNVQYTYYVMVCELIYHADVPNVYVADENGTNYLDLLP